MLNQAATMLRSISELRLNPIRISYIPRGIYPVFIGGFLMCAYLPYMLYSDTYPTIRTPSQVVNQSQDQDTASNAKQMIDRDVSLEDSQSRHRDLPHEVSRDRKQDLLFSKLRTTGNSDMSNTDFHRTTKPVTKFSVDDFLKSYLSSTRQGKNMLGDDVGNRYGKGVIQHKRRRPNILFLVADDLRPELGVYAGAATTPWLNPDMRTPQLDRLASSSLLFRRAYCQQAWCNPSRASFLTSRRPDTTMVHNNSVNFRSNMPQVVTLPQFFKQQGYVTLGMGKVFHQHRRPGGYDNEYSWSEPMFTLPPDELVAEGEAAWTAVTEEQREGKVLLDEMITELALDALRRVAPGAKSGARPFFVAVGMKKPHLPLVFPAENLEYYPMEGIRDPINPYIPRNMPRPAWATSNEISGKQEYLNYTTNWKPNSTLPAHCIRELRRAYYSSVTYIDKLIGQILEELEALGLANDTIVTFMGDHGYHLGEQGIFGKNTNFEVANHSPMMIRVPGMTDTGLVTDKLVEFVDIFPTLVELTGHPSLPRCLTDGTSQRTRLCTEGSSLVPLLQDPTTDQWKDRVFFQYPRFLPEHEDDIRWCMGYSVRTDRYRYTEWVHYDYEAGTGPDWSVSCGTELYDQNVDPHETNNIALDEGVEGLIQRLSLMVRQGWQAAIPEAELAR